MAGTVQQFLLFLFKVILAWILVAGLAYAFDVEAPETSDAQRVRKAINGSWFDSQTQEFIPPYLDEMKDHPVRRNGRLAGPGWVWQKPDWNLGWLANGLVYFVIVVISLLVLACLVLLLMHFVRSSWSLADKRVIGKTLQIDMTRVEELPFTVEKMASDPLTQARLLAESGNFDAAIVYLYGYYLLALDQARRIHLQKGKTNRMYLRELSPLPDLREIVQRTMLQFEEVYFGKHSISKIEFEKSWSSLDDFHRLLAVQPVKLNVSSNETSLAAEAVS